MAYIEYNCLQRFHELTTDDDTPAALRPVLRKLCSLYGLWSLSNHMATLYQGMHYIYKLHAYIYITHFTVLASNMVLFLYR